LEIITALVGALESLTEYVLPHAPFIGITLILLVIGHRMSTRVFTKPRAYRFYGPTAAGKWKWRFFYWGRETLPMHAILAGVIIGLLWRDPEGLGWNRAASVAYFASAGAVSMMLWAVIRGWAKKKGITLQLPGESEPPVGERPHSVHPYSDSPGWAEARHSSPPEEDTVEEEDPPTIPPGKRGLPPPAFSLMNPPPKITLHGERQVLEGQKPTTPKPGRK
jgi:hypothetical protein